jgi:hypothetical protein
MTAIEWIAAMVTVAVAAIAAAVMTLAALIAVSIEN